MLSDELVVAARLVEADPAADQDLLSVLGRESHRRVLHPKHRATQLGVAIFEREIPMARGWGREIRQLALDPDDAESLFQKQANLAVQARDGENIAPRFRAVLGNHENDGITWFTRARLPRTIAGFIHIALADTGPQDELSPVMGGHANP